MTEKKLKDSEFLFDAFSCLQQLKLVLFQRVREYGNEMPQLIEPIILVLNEIGKLIRMFNLTIEEENELYASTHRAFEGFKNE